MSRGLVWVMVVVVVMVCATSFATDDEDEDSSTKAFDRELIIRVHQKLTTGLYKTFARKGGNLLLSPWSVMSLLTVTYMMASGRTANEIGHNLNINFIQRKEILEGFQHLNENVTHHETDNTSTVLIDSLNGAFIGKRVRSTNRLKKVLRENLQTYIGPIIDDNDDKDSGDDDENRSAIKRNGLQQLLKERAGFGMESLVPRDKGALNKMALWLFNVLHFRGTWKTPFNPALTHKADFWLDGQHPVPVDTMETTASFPRSHYQQLGVTLLELPYGKSGRYGLFILLPDEKDGLSAMEKQLRQFNLESMLAASHWVRRAKVYLPRFKFQTDVVLNEAMKKLGFKRMFSPKNADFRRLEPGQRQWNKTPYVQTMLQRALIDVTENGTTASAGTALRLTSRRYVFRFQVNRPFMFVLRDKELRVNLFIGRVTDPRDLS